MIEIKLRNDTIRYDVVKMHTKGFTLLCYFLCLTDVNNIVRTSFNDIAKYTSIKDGDTIKKYLKELNNMEYIVCNKNIFKLDKNILFEIKVNYTVLKGYEEIPNNLFFDNIKIIKDKGWAIFCLLSLYYNKSWGYCNLKYNQIKEILDISSNETVSNYLKKLEGCGLIKNVNPKKKSVYINDFGEEVSEYSRNRYIVTHLML